MAETQLDLHPEAKAFLVSSKSLWDRFAETGSMSMDKMRSTLEDVAKVGGPGAGKDFQGSREELFIDSKEVKDGIPVYVYKPKPVDHGSDGGVPILVYFHGGGSIMGSRDVCDNTCKVLSGLAGCIVVNVEYRLAPEHKFPAMMNDGYDVVRWVLANRSLVGGASDSKVGVAGDSAGGQIAASVAHHVHGVDFQILVYAWLSPGETNYPSHEEFKKGPLLVQEGFTEWLESQVVEKREDLRDPKFHALLNEKFDHLPPALLIVAEFDQIRDESYEYSKRLTAAGVDNELYLAKGSIHGFFSSPGSFPELGGQAFAKAAEFINKIRKQH